MNELEVAITVYPRGESERTVYTTMPQAPRVGDCVALDDEALPILEITHVRWVEYASGWTVECSAR